MITSLTNSIVRHVTLLQAREKSRREEGLYVIEGVRMYSEVPLERLDGVYVTEEFLGGVSQETNERLAQTGYELVTEEVMKKMSDTQTPQGILCVVRTVSHELKEILEGGSLFCILDGLQDPGNLGTVFRSAEAAGASGVIMSRDTVSIYNPKSVRSTMGTLFRMPFAYVDDLCGAIEDMRGLGGIRTYASALDGSSAYTEFDYSGPTAFVIGNEGGGVTKAVRDAADERIFIPMEGEVESLNAAIAASVLLYESHRQRSR